MNYIQIEKKANCYTAEINANYRGEGEDEIFFYKTKEELVAALPEIIERAHAKDEEEKAEIAKKKAE